MERKQQTTQFLVLKSTTAFNTLAIIVMAVVVLYNYQRVREIDSDLNSCQKSLKIMREDLRSFKLKEAFAKSVRLTRRVRQIARPRNTKASSEKDFKVTTKPPITRVQSVADTNITAGKNLTDFCALCEKECARYLEKDQKVSFAYLSLLMTCHSGSQLLCLDNIFLGTQYFDVGLNPLVCKLIFKGLNCCVSSFLPFRYRLG